MSCTLVNAVLTVAIKMMSLVKAGNRTLLPASASINRVMYDMI